jgi:hypothetical protein
MEVREIQGQAMKMNCIPYRDRRRRDSGVGNKHEHRDRSRRDSWAGNEDEPRSL